MKFKIMSRDKARRYSYTKIKDNTIIISITDIGAQPVKFTPNPKITAALHIQFDDVNLGEENSITVSNANEILSFVNKNLKDTECIIVQCEAGISRSSGICLALMFILKENDTDIFENADYCPNLYCYRTILNSYFNGDKTYKNIKEYRIKQFNK